MTSTYFTPVGVLLGTSETTVYTAPASTSTMVLLYINNDDTVTRLLNMWIYTGSGPGTDAQRLVPTDYSMSAGSRLELGPMYLTTDYKITGTGSSANKINVVPMGIETT
jgi:hypothetical protein